MTTKVKITNESSNTHSDRHSVGVAVLQGADKVQVSSQVLTPGQSAELYVYPGQALQVTELQPAPRDEKPTQGTQN
jgi:hypothetical protein